MFKKFTRVESVTTVSKVKSSVQRGIRASIIEQYPDLEDALDDIYPKKADIRVAKCQDHVQLVLLDDHVLFIQTRDGAWYPHMKLLHQFPDMLPVQRTDKGAIKFILGGAHVMAPGLTSAGATTVDCEAGQAVTIMAEGKQHAIGVGKMAMSTADVLEKGKGLAIEIVHCLDDGLYRTDFDGTCV